MEDGEPAAFWYCLQDQFIQSYAIKEVFDMESSVRVEAIENLGECWIKMPGAFFQKLLYPLVTS